MCKDFYPIHPIGEQLFVFLSHYWNQENRKLLQPLSRSASLKIFMGFCDTSTCWLWETMDVCLKVKGQGCFFFLMREKAVAHAVCLPSPHHQCCPREKPRGQCRLVPAFSPEQNITSDCLRDSGSGFKFRVVLFIVWLQTMTTKPRLFYWRFWIQFFLLLDCLPPKSVLLFTHGFWLPAVPWGIST